MSEAVAFQYENLSLYAILEEASASRLDRDNMIIYALPV